MEKSLQCCLIEVFLVERSSWSESDDSARKAKGSGNAFRLPGANPSARSTYSCSSRQRRFLTMSHQELESAMRRLHASRDSAPEQATKYMAATSSLMAWKIHAISDYNLTTCNGYSQKPWMRTWLSLGFYTSGLIQLQISLVVVGGDGIKSSTGRIQSLRILICVGSINRYIG